MKLMFRLIIAAKKYWGYLIITLLSIAGLVGAQLYAPLVVRELTSMATTRDPELSTQALRMGLILAGVYLGQVICNFLRSYISHVAAWYFVADMQTKVYEKLQNLSLKFYHDKQTGQLMSRVVNDTRHIELLIAHAVPDVIANLVIIFGVTVMLFVINARLAFLSLLGVPVLLILSVVFAKMVLPIFRRAQVIMGEFNAHLQDNLSGMKEIQIFNQHKKETDKISKSAHAHTHAILEALKLSAAYGGAVQYISSIGTVIVIAYGGHMALYGYVDVSDIIAFIMYLAIFYQPISALARLNEDLQTSIAGAERVFEILDAPEDVFDKSDAVELVDVAGHIKFTDVNFSYIEGQDVLKNINVEILPGEVVAIVGPTGVGKTTFINLLNRFYDPVSGSITIDGKDVRDVTLHSLRNAMSNVMQDVFLFNESLAENIAYGRQGATREEVIEASILARAHDFIDGLDDGYDTIVGERGMRLSGGQKQRVSIARAVLRNNPILILDEATAAVDVETERQIREALDEVMQSRTTVIIAHRLSTIKKANKIIVLKDGMIEDIGTHDELTLRDGLYAHMSEINMNA